VIDLQATEAIVRGDDREISILVAREDLTIIHSRSPAGERVAGLHVHHEHTDAFYVLEGELTFQLGDALATRGPGTLTFAKRGSIHTVANLSGAPARYLLVCTPAGFERRFEGGEGPEVVFVGPTIPEKLVGGA
jgi:quercetin dioxygenase-like cupin family protein